jgi:hypothetical protein
VSGRPAAEQLAMVLITQGFASSRAGDRLKLLRCVSHAHPWIPRAMRPTASYVQSDCCHHDNANSIGKKSCGTVLKSYCSLVPCWCIIRCVSTAVHRMPEVYS